MTAGQTPILYCEPRRPRGPVSGECWFLVPANAWQVILEGAYSEDLNCFEKLVLDLSKGADYSAQEIATMTHLHEELIEQILANLNKRGLLKDSDRDTSDSEERKWTEKDQCGWLLQDPVTGSVFPTFWNQLPVVEADQSKTPVRIEFGDEGRPFTKWGTPLPFPDRAPVSPDSREILRSLRARTSQEFQARLGSLVDLVHPVAYRREDPSERITIRKVTTLGAPLEVFLATAGIVLGEQATDWHVCCPVGTGLSRELKTRLERSCEEGDRISESIVRKLCKDTSHSSIDDWKSAHAMNQALADRKLMEAFGPRIHDFEGAAAQLLSFFEAWLLLESAGDSASPNTIENVCNTSRKALEAIFKELGKRNPLDELDVLLPGKNEEEHAKLVREWAQEFGFNSEDLNTSVLNVRKSWIKRSALDLANYYSLSSVIGALLVQARKQEQHPLRLVAPRAPELFELIGEIIQLGNPGSHDNSHMAIDLRFPDRIKVLSLRDTLIRVTSLLLDPEENLFESTDHSP